MPICEIDPWRTQYFENAACPADVFIPTEDSDAWLWNPEHRWVYDKLAVAVSQGLQCCTARHRSAELSGVLQADLQPKGHGRRQPPASVGRRLRRRLPARSYLVDPARRQAHQQRRCPGRRRAAVVAPCRRHRQRRRDVRLLGGPRRSRARRRGMVRRLVPAASQGLHRHGQSRDHRRPHHRGASALRRPVARSLRRGLGRRAGPPLCREANGGSTIRQRRTGYSVVLFVPHGPHYRHPPAELQREIGEPAGISSLQITFHEDLPPGRHAMPPGGFRVAIVNCWDRAAGNAAREMLRAHFESSAVGTSG